LSYLGQGSNPKPIKLDDISKMSGKRNKFRRAMSPVPAATTATLGSADNRQPGADRKNATTVPFLSRHGWKLYAIVILAAVSFSSWNILSKKRHALSAPDRAVTLLQGVGGVHHPITTHSPEAQAYFDQGLALCFGFDKPNAILSFRKAEQLDASCAMAFWGEAYALGPDINSRPDATKRADGLIAIRKAMKLAQQSSPRERDYVSALTERYPLQGTPTDAELNRAYAEAMRGLSARYSEDLDAAVLYAESVMDLTPWHLWNSDGTPVPGSEPVVPTLQSVLHRQPDHLGANHLLVHALEGSPHPEQALVSALKLPELAPRSAHLVHMPSHILIHTGDYAGAVKANVAARALGDEYLNCCGPPARSEFNYHGHNLKFLIYAAEMAGMSREAMDAAYRLKDMARAEIAADPERKQLNDVLGYDALVLARFCRWNEILRLSAPTKENSRAAERFHFARALAYSATGDIAAAKRELAAQISSEEALDSTSKNTKAVLKRSVLTSIASGRIARAMGDYNGAVDHFRAAILSQDEIGYEEPPVLPWPARDELGSAQLAAGDWAGAEQTYRESLKQFPMSGRALLGLSQALSHLGKATEASSAAQQFQEAWKGADVPLGPKDL